MAPVLTIVVDGEGPTMEGPGELIGWHGLLILRMIGVGVHQAPVAGPDLQAADLVPPLQFRHVGVHVRAGIRGQHRRPARIQHEIAAHRQGGDQSSAQLRALRGPLGDLMLHRTDPHGAQRADQRRHDKQAPSRQ